MNVPTIRALLVEDNPGDARLLRALLGEVESSRIELEHVDRLSVALDRLDASEAEAPEVVLLDLSLPDAQGLDALRQLVARHPDLPLVVLTGNDDRTIALRAVQEGAQDYLVKGRIDGELLHRALHYAIERQRLVTQIRNMSLTDELTGLYNRRGFFAVAEQQARIAERKEEDLVVLFADMDGMKEINDQLGHEAGDQALRETAELLLRTFRKSDVVARMGGDEFVVLALDCAPGGIEAMLRRMEWNRGQLNGGPDRAFLLEVSVGTVCWDPAELSIDEVLSRADTAMYEAKKARRAAGRRAAVVAGATAAPVPPIP